MKNKDLEKQLNAYIKDKRTQEECVGFVDGYNSAKEYYRNKIYLAGCIGVVSGIAFGILLIILKFI